MSFAHLLTDICIVSRFVSRGTDAFATPTYGPKLPVFCAFQESFQKVRDTDGNEVVSTSSIATVDAIGIEDRVWLPTENGVKPDASNDDDALTLLSKRNDRSRSSGFRMHQTFF